MASTRRGCGNVRYNPSAQIMRVKIAYTTFGGEHPSGAAITPACPFKGDEANYFFSFVDLIWKPKYVGDALQADDPEQLGKTFHRPSLFDSILAMNWTEMDLAEVN